jgi:hypothetical protein
MMAILAGNGQYQTLLQNRLSGFVSSRNVKTFGKAPLQFRSGMSRKIIKSNPVVKLKRNLINISRRKTNIIRAEASMRHSLRTLQSRRVGRAFQGIR